MKNFSREFGYLLIILLTCPIFFIIGVNADNEEKIYVPITDVEIDIDDPNNWIPKKENWEDIKDTELSVRLVGRKHCWPKGRLRIQYGDRLYIWGQFFSDDTPVFLDAMGIGIKTGLTQERKHTDYADYIIIARLIEELEAKKGRGVIEPPYFDEIEVAYSIPGTSNRSFPWVGEGINYLIAIPEKSLLEMYQKDSMDELNEISACILIFDVDETMEFENLNILRWPTIYWQPFGRLYFVKPSHSVSIYFSGLPDDYSLDIYIDGDKEGLYLASYTPSFTFKECEFHEISVDEYVSGGTGTRYFCANKSRLLSENKKRMTFAFITQHFLKVNSSYSSVSDSGWHEEGSTPSFSINSTSIPAGFGTKYVFLGWSGDSNATAPDATIVMDSPKTVTAVWEEDKSQLNLIIGVAIGMIGILVISSIVFIKESKRKHIELP